MSNTNTQIQIAEQVSFENMSIVDLSALYKSDTCSREDRRAINALACWQEYEMVSANKLFGDLWKGPNMNFPKRIHRHPDVDTAPATYVPDPVLLMDITFYVTGERHLSLGIYGDTGTGKSELPRFVSDKLNIPMMQISLTQSSREDKLMGTYLIENGETFFDLSVLPMAYDRRGPGYILVVNEIDKGCDSVIAKLHDITDNKPFTIDDTGEVIEPHDNFRFIATGQTSGCGDSRGIYNVQRLDRAFVARFSWIHAQYPDKDVMQKILKLSFPRLEDSTLIPMCDFYELCTRALQNGHLDAQGLELLDVLDGDQTTLATPVSIRLMKGWANLLVQFGSYRSIRESYDRTIGMSAELEDKYPMGLMLTSCFGDLLDAPPAVEPLEVEYPESEAMDISEVNLGLFVYQDESVKKIWMIGCDERGVHTLYTHPKESRIVYYHKPINEFDEGLLGIQQYVEAKCQQKRNKKYVEQVRDGSFRYDTQNGKLTVVTQTNI